MIRDHFLAMSLVPCVKPYLWGQFHGIYIFLNTSVFFNCPLVLFAHKQSVNYILEEEDNEDSCSHWKEVKNYCCKFIIKILIQRKFRCKINIVLNRNNTPKWRFFKAFNNFNKIIWFLNIVEMFLFRSLILALSLTSNIFICFAFQCNVTVQKDNWNVFPPPNKHFNAQWHVTI